MDNLVQSSIDNTIQSNYRNEIYTNPVSLMTLFAKVNDIIAPWWSRRRDYELRGFVKQIDHISGAVYNMCAKMSAIPVRVEARDKSIKAQVKAAEKFTEIILAGSQFGEGWTQFYSRFVEELLTQDNGAFAEIIGEGDPDGPLVGAPISVAHLDSSRCTRTGNAEYPVIYEDVSGRLYKLHFTRVISLSQMPATDVRMNGVGYCAVSRALNSAQNLYDIAVYKQEKLGSRPQRSIILTGGGLDPEDIAAAAGMAERQMSNMGLTRFSKTLVIGNRNIIDPKLQHVDLASLPDGFDEKESTILGMAIVAMAFGMDARELFPVMDSGATKADAIVQHMKQRGKGPGQIIESVEKQFDAKFLPPYLKLVSDYQDDAQDRQAAEIKSIRSQSRQRDIISGVTNTRVERELMFQSGEINHEQFVELELSDGRLEDGLPVSVMFSSDDKDYKELLSGINEQNYLQKIDEISGLILKSKDVSFIRKGRIALAAIKSKYVEPMEQEKINRQLALEKPTGRVNNPGGKPDTSYNEERFGRKLGADETLVRGDQESDLEE